MNEHAQSGFSLSELCIALIVMATLAAMAIPTLSEAIRRSNADAAAQLIAQQLSYARTVAIGNHEPVLVRFSPDANSIGVAGGTGAARGPFVLPGSMQIQKSALAPATPDNLGQVLGAGSHTEICFMDNGAAMDGAGVSMLSGTIFLQHPKGLPATRRAITLLGGTGRIHIWRYDKDTENWK